MAEQKDVMRTRIWLEEPERDDPFSARSAHCHGYDVHGAMVGQARWVEMLYLLLRGEAPSREQADLLEALAVALANAGPRDAAVHAAMCGGVGGSTAASCLIAALAVGAGQLGGGREVFLAMQRWAECGTDLQAWQAALEAPAAPVASIWPTPERPPGFEPHGLRAAGTVLATLSRLASIGCGPHLPWLGEFRPLLERHAGHPLAMSGVAAAALADLGFTPDQGEMLHLLLRLPGAAAHALEQRELGHKQFPFFRIELDHDSEVMA